MGVGEGRRHVHLAADNLDIGPGFAGAGRFLRFIKRAKRGHTRGERRQRGIAHAVPPIGLLILRAVTPRCRIGWPPIYLRSINHSAIELGVLTILVSPSRWCR